MFTAYTGMQPYAFLSYSHKDKKRIFPLIEQLRENGYNIWYDAGILPAEEWADTIAKKISEAQIILLIVSTNSIKSNNVKREIYFAVSKCIPVLPFYIDDVTLPGGLALQLGIHQAIAAKNEIHEDFQMLKGLLPTSIFTEDKDIWSFEEDFICCLEYIKFVFDYMGEDTIKRFVDILEGDLPNISRPSLRRKACEIKRVALEVGLEDRLDFPPCASYSKQCKEAFLKATDEFGEKHYG